MIINNNQQNLSGICKANGCPLVAQFVTDRNKSNKAKWGLCQHHHAQPSKHWPRITRIILSDGDRQKALNIISDIDSLNTTDYALSTGETIQHWKARLSNSISTQVSANKNNAACYSNVKQIKQLLSQGQAGSSC